MQDYMSLDLRTVTLRLIGGRYHFYAPDHPLSIKGARTGMRGWVNAARHIASVQRGAWLTTAEVVRYTDGDYCNLSPDNLVIVSRSNLPSMVNYSGEKVTLICPVCNLPFDVAQSLASKRVNHNKECQGIASRRFEVTYEALLLDVWEYSTVQVGEKYGVSDKAIEKRCKSLGVIKPPRGYWRLMELNWDHNDALIRLGWSAKDVESLNDALANAEEIIGAE